MNGFLRVGGLSLWGTGALFLSLLAPAAMAAPQEGKEDPAPVSGLRVVSTSLNAEAERAELCLTLSADVAIHDREKIAGALTLMKEGLKQKVQPGELSLTPRDICLQQLQHRRRYEVTLRKLEGLDGSRLAAPYSVAFAVPDRKPSLTFLTEGRAGLLPRHLKAETKKTGGEEAQRAGKAPLLRSVNVLATRLTLYRVPQTADYPGAWQQFTQINLSPSESLTYARAKGQLVFESDLVFGDKPNDEQTLHAPLPPDVQMTPGLYFLSAAPRGKDADKPGLFAGQWFLVSRLYLSAVRTGDEVNLLTALAEEGKNGTKPAAAASFRLLTRDGKVLAEGKTDAEGSATIKLKGEQAGALALITASIESGDVDIVPMGADRSLDLSALTHRTSLTTDRDVYQPGSMAVVSLRAENANGLLEEPGESVLKLLRPDGRVYGEQRVVSEKTGALFVNMPLPVIGSPGKWSFVWSRPDGAKLAEKTFRLASVAAGGTLAVEPVRENGDVVRVTVRATTAKGEPLPFETGVLTVRAARPDVSGVKGFVFGRPPRDRGEPLYQLSFLTDAQGVARLVIGDDAAEKDAVKGVQAVAVSAALGLGLTAEPQALSLTQGDLLVGLRPSVIGRSFPQNSQARFEVIGVDASGKRRAAGDLYYAVYEEGRSFKWYPAEGYWDYKPLPYHRRVGGGKISVGATAPATLVWPVTTGQYALEIMNERGEVLARETFEAGPVEPRPVAEGQNGLALTTHARVLDVGKDNKLTFDLPFPAMVALRVVDDRVRLATQKLMEAGPNALVVNPGADWGRQLMVRLEVVPLAGGEPLMVQRRFDSHDPAQDLALTVRPPASAVAGGSLVLPVQVQKIARGRPTFVSVVATPLPSDGRTDVPAVRVDRAPLSADGKGQIKLNLPTFEGALRLAVTAWNDAQSATSVTTLSAQPALSVAGMPPEHLGVGDRAEVVLTMRTKGAVPGAYSYELKLPEGITATGFPQKGKIFLPKDGAQTLRLFLSARAPTEDLVQLEVQGPGGFRYGQSWPVTVRADAPLAWSATPLTLDPGQEIALPQGPADKIKEKTAVLLSPLPLPDVTRPLYKLVRGEPQTTIELALWLEATRLWQEPILSLGLVSDLRLGALREARLRQLQLRQNDDGGFAAIRAGMPSDLPSTAAALAVLSGEAERATALGGDWLAGKLQNTWFEEKERPSRAVAFEALARLRRADLSALRYFGETSWDQTLPPQAQAALALALVQGGDEEAAKRWIDKARDSLAQSGEGPMPRDMWHVLRLLALNEKVPADDIAALMGRTDVPKIENAFEESASMLIAVARTALRAGSWHAAVDKEDKKVFGLLTLSLAEGDPTPKTRRVVKNNAERRLYGLQIVETSLKTAKGSEDEALTLERRIFTIDGVGGEGGEESLSVGGYAVLVLQGGAFKDSAEPLRVTLPRLSSIEAALPGRGDPALLRGVFPWLGENLTPVQDIVDSPTGLSFAVDASRPWRVAVLLRTLERGSYALAPLRARAASGELLAVGQNALRLNVE